METATKPPRAKTEEEFITCNACQCKRCIQKECLMNCDATVPCGSSTTGCKNFKFV